MGIRSQNNPLAAYLDVFSNTGTDAMRAGGGVPGLTATGGTTNDYTDSGLDYRAHIFTSSGSFIVSELGGLGNTVEYLVVAGGGGAGGTPPGPGAIGTAGSVNTGGGGGGGTGPMTSTGAQGGSGIIIIAYPT